MPYSQNSYSYSFPSLNSVLGDDWSSSVGSLMDRGVSGASTLLDRRFAGEKDLQAERLKNAIELARMEQGTAAGLQREQLDTQRLLADMGYDSAASLQEGQLGFGREQLRETGRQFDAGLAESRNAPIRSFNLQRAMAALGEMSGRQQPPTETPLVPTLGARPRYPFQRGNFYTYTPRRA